MALSASCMAIWVMAMARSFIGSGTAVVASAIWFHSVTESALAMAGIKPASAHANVVGKRLRRLPFVWLRRAVPGWPDAAGLGVCFMVFAPEAMAEPRGIRTRRPGCQRALMLEAGPGGA
jgi:hypothetical protein